ncbi:probable E3 ubiquitin-protein ligase MARCHF10 [Megalops cyprinoides]|uniref:probable E3 ubiquitin-protein ligase MARCHF10 n=1 Tax=Megalops cyprinoides TaxID=118141 RepID=UPI00186489C0|nr:probable E3 ubiquitin-protein ligase MARCHF10 [Megalops cyprinoides]
MALQDVRREVVQIHVNTARDRSSPTALVTKPPADPEKLRRITESLLEEEAEEEEGDLCRICQCGGGTPENPLQMPCQCTGSLQYVHQDCLKRWIQTKVQSGAELAAVKTCELCKASLHLDLEDFDVEECYRRHRQTQVERVRPELHLLLLLQQRLLDVVQAVESHSNTTFGVSMLPAMQLQH